MKKDKKTTIGSRWQQWQGSPNFFQDLVIGFILSIVLVFSVFILVHRYINRPKEKVTFVYNSPVPALPAPTPEAVLLQNEVALQNHQMAQLEDKLNQLQLTLQLSHQLIAFELLQEILEGHLPVNTLILYLQKTPEPWTTDILNALSLILESKSYAQLQDLLVLPPLSQPISLSQRVKNILNSFVRIRKLNADGHYTVGNIEEIRAALRVHNIQQALDVFGKLPPDEQAHLSLWKQAAQDRLTLEAIKRKMLLELSRVEQR